MKYYGGDPQLEKYLREKFVPLGEHSYVVQLLDAFMYSGPNGQHYVMVFEILGVNLLEIIKRYEYKGVPLHLARIIGKQCLMGLDYLHWICQLIHTDLKPENVILNLAPDELKEIQEKGYLTTTNVFNLPDKIKELLSFNVYDPRNKWWQVFEQEKQKPTAVKQT